MLFVLVSNVLEHPGFPTFLTEVTGAHPESTVLSAGDLLNVFPEPGEDFEGSMFQAIFGARVVDEVRRLVETGFTDADESWLIEPLRDMFLPGGTSTRRALAMADARYRSLFAEIDAALGSRPCYFIDGNMDYPSLTRERAAQTRSLVPISDEVLDIGGLKLAGMGGIPNTAHPFSGVVEISPNEMSEDEYERRLSLLAGVDVLCTHLSPEEAPSLARFLDRGGARVLVCRAPFDFRQRGASYRGRSTVRRHGDALVVTVRPFEWPSGSVMLLDVEPGGAAEVSVFSYDGTARPAA